MSSPPTSSPTRNSPAPPSPPPPAAPNAAESATAGPGPDELTTIPLPSSNPLLSPAPAAPRATASTSLTPSSSSHTSLHSADKNDDINDSSPSSPVLPRARSPAPRPECALYVPPRALAALNAEFLAGELDGDIDLAALAPPQGLSGSSDGLGSGSDDDDGGEREGGGDEDGGVAAGRGGSRGRGRWGNLFADIPLLGSLWGGSTSHPRASTSSSLQSSAGGHVVLRDKAARAAAEAASFNAPLVATPGASAPPVAFDGPSSFAADAATAAAAGTAVGSDVGVNGHGNGIRHTNGHRNGHGNERGRHGRGSHVIVGAPATPSAPTDPTSTSTHGSTLTTTATAAAAAAAFGHGSVGGNADLSSASASAPARATTLHFATPVQYRIKVKPSSSGVSGSGGGYVLEASPLVSPNNPATTRTAASTAGAAGAAGAAASGATGAISIPATVATATSGGTSNSSSSGTSSAAATAAANAAGIAGVSSSVPAEFLKPFRALLRRGEKLGELRSTAICGNDATGSLFYMVGQTALEAGALAPVAAGMVAGTLYLFRAVYSEAVTALPLNGGAYNVLLNTTKKTTAAFAAVLTLLSYVATAVVCASEAGHYLVRAFGGSKELIPLFALCVLVGFAALSCFGVGESASVATGVFLLHLTTMTVLVLFCCGHVLWQGVSQLGGMDAAAPEGMGFPLFYFRENWRFTFEALQPKAWLALFYGFSAAMLGVTGFESSANYVEEQKPGVFVKTLKNMWVLCSIFNISVSFFAVTLLDLSAVFSSGHAPTAVAALAKHVGGRFFDALVCADACLVLSGGVLTAYVGVSGLVRRMALDRCLPQVLLAQNSWRGTYHWIIISFCAVCCSLFSVLEGDVKSLAQTYSLAFLFVMALFALGVLLIKTKRATLVAEVTASWPATLVAFTAAIAAAVGAVMRDPAILPVFTLYFTCASALVLAMVYRVHTLALLAKLAGALPCRRCAARRAPRTLLLANQTAGGAATGAAAGAAGATGAAGAAGYGAVAGSPSATSSSSSSDDENDEESSITACGVGPLSADVCTSTVGERAPLLSASVSAHSHFRTPTHLSEGGVKTPGHGREHGHGHGHGHGRGRRHEQQMAPLGPGEWSVCQWLLDSRDAIVGAPMGFFTKTGSLSVLNKAVLYIKANEDCKWVKIIHVFEDEARIPPYLAHNVNVLADEYPDMRFDLVLVKGSFSPAIVAYVSVRLQIGRNHLFITTPQPGFALRLEDLGGVRLITH